MSTTVDQRVVEMRFDNQQFEKNVSTTMSTLDKLKQKLNLTGAAKGIDDVGRAAKNVDMSALGRGVEQVGLKFDAMYTIADQALRNITTRVQHTAENMVKALTIDPIKTGFQEYETQINAVQTILANTQSKGSTIDDVNVALDELNKYADKTIYNFTEMTRNIGTFTAAGIELDTSVNAIQGIANLAAVSGSTSQQASTAMYQLSQALASGTVKLMDWNSVIDAGMGGELFRNALKETSKLLGTGAEAAIEAEGSFRESLKTGWLTSEVLTETLKKFTTTGANEYVAEYIGQSPEVVQAALAEAKATYGEAEAIEYASKALAEKYGKNQEEIKSALQFAQTAEDAATKVKTFTQLWDVLKESAQSGWSSTWKLIIGDFEEAKSLLTPLADLLTGFINKFSDARNAVLKSALGKGFTETFDKVKNVLKPIQQSADSIKEVVNSVKDYAAVVDEIIGGKWGNGQERWNKLTEAGYDWAHAQNLVNEKLGNSVRHATDYQEAQNGVAESQEKVDDITTEYIADLAEMSEAQLKELGYTDEQIQAFHELAKAAEKTGIPIKEFVNNIDNIDGRYLLINSFKNAGDALLDTFKAIGKAWKEIFPPKSTEEKANALFNILAAMHKFTRGMADVIYKNGKFTETGNNLIRTLKGVFAILDLVTSIVGGGFKIAFKLLTSVLGYFNMDILGLTAIIGDALVKFRDWVKSLFNISDVLDVVVPALKSGAKAVNGWIDALKNLKGVQNLIESIKILFKAITSVDIGNFSSFGKTIGNAFDKIAEAIKKLTGIDLKSIGSFIFDGLIKGLGDGALKVIDIITQTASNLINNFCEVLGIHSPSKVFMALGGFIIAGLLLGIQEGFISVPESLQTIVDKCLGVIKSIDWGTVFAIGVSVAGLLFIKKVGDALENFSAPFAGLGDILGSISSVITSFSKVTKAMATNIKTKALKNLAITLAILVGCVIAIVKIAGDDYLQMWNAVGIIVVLAGVLVGLSWAMNKMSDVSIKFQKGKGLNIEGIKSSLLTIAIAVGILAGVTKLLSGINTTQAIQGFVGLVGIMAAVLGFVYILQKITEGDISENIDKVGSMMLKLSIALLLMVGVCKLVGKLSPGELAKGAVFLIAMGIFIKAITAIAKDSGQNVSKVGGMMVKLAFAMGLMVLVCKLVDLLSASEMIKGGLFAAAMTLFVKGLVKATKVGKDQQIAKLGGMLLAISTSMIMMIGICKLVNKLTPSEMLKGGVFALAFVAFVGILVQVTKVGSDKQIAKVSGTIIAISVAIGILAAVSMLLSLLSIGSLAKGITAVSILSVMMSMMIKSLKGAQNVMASLIVMTVAIATMSIAVAALSLIDPKRLATSTACLSSLMGMFALMIKSLGALKGVNKIMGPLIAMTVVVGLLAGILWALSKLEIQSSIENAGALSVLLLSMSGALLIISKISTNASKALVGIGLLTAMTVPLLAFAMVLKQLSGLENTTSNVLILTALMYAMTGLLAILSLIGKSALKALVGVGLLTAMWVPMMAFVDILKRVSGIDVAKENVLLLAGLMTVTTVLLGLLTIIGFGAITAIAGIVLLTAMRIPMMTFIDIMKRVSGVDLAVGNIMLLMSMMTLMTGLLTQLAIVGPFALIGVAAMQGLILIMGEIALFATAIGALVEKFPSLQTFLDTGLPILEQIAGSMGTMIGKFIGGIGEGIADSLASIGDDIIEFMESLAEAADVASGIEGSSFDGVKQLIEALIGVGLASVGMSVADIFTNMLGDKSAMDRFEQDGIAFFKAIKAISAEMTGFTFPEDFDTEGLKTLLEALKSVASATIGLSIADMFTSMAGDEGAMEKFKTDGVAFFKAIKAISAEMTGFTFPEDFSTEGLKTLLDSLKSVGTAMAGVSIADLFTQMIGEEGSMEKFKNDAITFFQAIKAIVPEMTGFVFPEDFSVSGLKKLFEVFNSVGSYTKSATWDDIWTFGGTTMDKFKEDGVTFFKAIKEISAESAGISLIGFDTAETAVSRIKSIIASVNGLNYDGVAKFTGIGTGGFGADGPMHDIAVAIKDFGDTVNGINVEAVNVSVTTAKKIVSLIRSLTSLDASGIENFKAKSIGTAMKDYNGQVKSIETDVISSSISSAKKLVSLISSLAGLDNSGISLFNPKPIGDKIKSYSNSVADINITSITSSISAATKLKNFINSLSGIDAGGVTSFKKAIDTLGTVQLDNIRKSFSGAIPNLSKVGAQLTDGITKGMQSRQGALIVAMSSINKQLVNTASKPSSTLQTIGATLMTKLKNGINSKKSTVKEAIASPLTDGTKKIRGYYNNFYNAGSYVSEGLAEGISSNISSVEAAAEALAEAAEKAVRAKLEINSPSKVFRAIGSSIPEGFVQGITMFAGAITTAVSDMSNTALDGTNKVINTIYDMMLGDLDVQPTIRPVLDLTNVQSGAAAISGLFGNGVSVDTMANVNSIGSIMNGRNQNGNNDDVISAINKLGASLANVGGDTYNIDGITYDDGSNIATAMKDIVREARIERRR